MPFSSKYFKLEDPKDNNLPFFSIKPHLLPLIDLDETMKSLQTLDSILILRFNPI